MHVKSITYIILLCLLPLVLSAKEKENVSLQLKWFSSFQFAGYYMAKERGFYDEENLNVIIKERDPTKNHVKQVINNEAQYGVSDSTLLLYRAVGQPVKILASIFQRSPLVFISKKESGIKTPYELKGKVLSYQKGLDDAPLVTLFEEANINEKDFSFKNFNFNVNDFVEGNVDVISAYISNEPYSLKEKGIDVNIINPINYGINFYGDNLFTSEKEILDNPKRVEAFIRASIKGWKYALDNKVETIKILKEKYNAQNTYNHLLYEANVIESMIMRDVVDIGYTSISRLEDIVRNYVYLGKVTNSESSLALDGLVYKASNDYKLLSNNDYFKVMLTLFALVLIIAIYALVLNSRLKEKVNLVTKRLEFDEELIDNNLIISQTNLNGVITDISQALCKITGFTKEELLGKKHSIFRHPDTPYETYNQMWTTITKNERWVGELKNIKKNGDFFWLDMTIEPVFENKQKVGYKSISTNITGKKILEMLSVKDKLTKVYNKRHFDDLFPKFINSAKRNNELISFLIMDIDFFKEFNEVYGHKKGDDILVQISGLFENFLHRSDDYKFRIGPEEFAILYKCNNKDDALKIANDLRLSIKQLRILNERNRASKYLTVSIGLYCLQAKDIIDEEEVYKQADVLVNQAKEKGGNLLITN